MPQFQSHFIKNLKWLNFSWCGLSDGLQLFWSHLRILKRLKLMQDIHSWRTFLRRLRGVALYLCSMHLRANVAFKQILHRLIKQECELYIINSLYMCVICVLDHTKNRCSTRICGSSLEHDLMFKINSRLQINNHAVQSNNLMVRQSLLK